MNKFFTKIAALSVGLAMAIGVGVAVGSKDKDAAKADAAAATVGSWTKITGNPTAGDEILIVSTSSNVCLAPKGTETAAGGFSQITFTAQSNPSNGWIVGGSSNNGWTFKDTTGSTDYYLANDNASNGLKSQSASQTWTITEQSTSGNYRIAGTGSRQITPYSTSNWRTYAASAAADVNIYKKSAAKTPDSIALSGTYPTTFAVNDSFSHTGMVVTVTYKNSGGTADVSAAATWSSPDMSTAGVKTVTVSYTENNTTVTHDYSITVKALSSIAVTTAPTKTTYDEGDSFDPTGMVVTGTYSDSSTSNVTGSCTFSPNPLTYGTTEVTISYSGKTTTQAVTVNKVSSITLTATVDVGASSSNNSPDTVIKNGITMYGDDAAFATTEYRYYSGSTLTFTSTIGEMASIEFTGDTSKKMGDISLSSGGGEVTIDGNDASWSGSAEEVSFTFSAQNRATKVVITLASSEPSASVSPSSVSLKTNDTVGITLTATVRNVDNPTYTWTKNNNYITLTATENDNEVVVKPSTEVAQTAKVTLTVGGVNPALTVEINVTISVPGPGESEGTAFTVAQAKQHIDDVITGGESSGNDGNSYYVRGIISQIDEYQSGAITYWISDNGTTTGHFEVYKGKGISGADFSSVDDLTVGDTVVVYGFIKLYSETYEFASNNQLVSRIPVPKVNSITLTPSIVTVAPDAAGDIVDLFTNIVIDQDEGCGKTVNDIIWTTDDDNVFYIDDGEYLVAGEHKTSTTIHATIDGTVYGSATISVVNPNQPYITYDIPITWTVVSDISTLAAGDKVILTGVKNEVAYAAGTYSSGNNVPADTEHTLTVSGSNVTGVVSTMIYTLETGNKSGTLAFKDSAGKYLYAQSSNNNNMKSQSELDDNASFILNSNGTVVAQGTNTRCYMRYNNTSTSNLFSCYGSTSTTGNLITFYKQSGGGTDTLDLDDTILTLVRSKMSTYKDENNEDQYGISVCDYFRNTELTLSSWENVASGFTPSIISTYKLNYARANRNGNDVEKFLSAYDYVVENYGEDFDFLGRIESGKVSASQVRIGNNLFIENNNSIMTIIVIISIVSLTAVGGYFLLKKKKEQ